MISSKPDNSPRVPPPNNVTLEVRISVYDWGRVTDIQSLNANFGDLLHFSVSIFSSGKWGGAAGPGLLWESHVLVCVHGPASGRYSAGISRHQPGFPEHLPDSTSSGVPGGLGLWEMSTPHHHPLPAGCDLGPLHRGLVLWSLSRGWAWVRPQEGLSQLFVLMLNLEIWETSPIHCLPILQQLLLGALHREKAGG